MEILHDKKNVWIVVAVLVVALGAVIFSVKSSIIGQAPLPVLTGPDKNPVLPPGAPRAPGPGGVSSSPLQMNGQVKP